jgi:hypothetical protein
LYLTTGRSFPLGLSESKPSEGFLGGRIGSRRSRGSFRRRERPSGTLAFRHAVWVKSLPLLSILFSVNKTRLCTLDTTPYLTEHHGPSSCSADCLELGTMSVLDRSLANFETESFKLKLARNRAPYTPNAKRPVLI